jgi:hypothetical protein
MALWCFGSTPQATLIQIPEVIHSNIDFNSALVELKEKCGSHGRAAFF